MRRLETAWSTLEWIFTICVLLSATTLISFIAARFGLYGIGPSDDIAVRSYFIHSWLALLLVAGLVGSLAVIAKRRLFSLLLVPLFCCVEYTLCLLSILLMTPYSTIDTLEQLLGAQLGLYAAGYLFWLVLVKLPVPQISRRR